MPNALYYFSEEVYRLVVIQASKRMERAYKKGDPETYCAWQTFGKRILKNLASEDAYGLTNPIEDKAQIFATYADPDALRNDLDPKTPRIRGKTIFQLARLYEKKDGPAIVQTLAATAAWPRKRYEPLIDNSYKCGSSSARPFGKIAP